MVEWPRVGQLTFQSQNSHKSSALTHSLPCYIRVW